MSSENYSVVSLGDIFIRHIQLGGSDGKESACNTGDPVLIPRSGRSSVEGSGYPLQYSCLENSMHREAWWAADHGAAKSQTRLRLTHTHTQLIYNIVVVFTLHWYESATDANVSSIPNPVPHLPPHPSPPGWPSVPPLSSPVSMIQLRLVIDLTYDNIHVSMPLSRIIPL